MQGCVHSGLASRRVQADTIVLQMLLLETAQIRRLGQDEAWNLLLICWQVVAVVPPRAQRRSVHRRSRTKNVCFGLGCCAWLILCLCAALDLCK